MAMISIGPYRRDLVGKSLFHFAEILFGIAFASVLFSAHSILVKIAFCAFIVLLFTMAVVACPHEPPGTEERDA